MVFNWDRAVIFFLAVEKCLLCALFRSLFKPCSYHYFIGLTHEEVLAQGLLFFLAGFETTANTLSLLGYSLATNPECQEKLLKEIDDVMKDHVSLYVIYRILSIL